MKHCLFCLDNFESSTWLCPHCGNQPYERNNFLTFTPELDCNEGFDPALYSQLASIEAKHFWFRARNELIAWALQTYFPQAQNMLEIGCGTGFVLSGLQERFPHLALAGSEIFTEGLIFAAERLRAMPLYQMDARKIPFRDEFDVIGAFDVLEHIGEDQEVLAQMRMAVTESKGGILLTVPQHPFLWSQSDEMAHHVRRYFAKELREKVERAGFQVLCATSFVSLLFPLVILSRCVLSKARPEDPYAEFRISGAANACFEKMMQLERATIKAGVSYAYGSSLLMIARVR
jgi:SAM-dependent methyltransferase